MNVCEGCGCAFSISDDDVRTGDGWPVACSTRCQQRALDGDVLVCESCGWPADLMLLDGSTWCISCDVAARDLAYDNLPACLLAI